MNDIVHKTWPTLYKSSARDAEQQWELSVIERETPIIKTVFGQVGGKQQTAEVAVMTGKNLGRKNETTPLQQALSEAESKWKKQHDKGYSEARGGASVDLKPMLAHKYEDAGSVNFPAWLQPKLDGVRAVAHRRGDSILLLSRLGKEHKGLAHIREELLPLLDDGETWDGELYAHGMPFQELVSLVKKDQPGSVRLEYHVYDRFGPEPFGERFGVLLRRFAERATSSKCVPVNTMLVTTPADVEHQHALHVERGYEGVMLRAGDCLYRPGVRSRDLLKVKAWKDAEFEVVDVVPGVGKEADKGTFVCKTDRGATFQCRPRGDDSLRAQYLADKDVNVGKRLTVRFFEWTTSDPPVPRFPVGVGLRDFE